ncbi:hypothetical protein [Chitinophaga barathri]|uniref:Uncharacterized protein n=1 Tax=Chitinophaga barathri TaxID=1647451 RepID=A0A3N4M799_9BACT|nr:hypothetical protein [Chitinophaga barathri]RPD39334.1 hypothetical protein EG028_19600 [Chitinophaga barathri]
MLENVTWTQFFIGVGVMLLVYYLFVFFKYFNQHRLLVSGTVTNDASKREDSNDALAEETIAAAEELSDRIAESIAYAADTKMRKDELLQRLRAEISDFPTLDTPAFREGIKNVILSETDRNGSVTLSEREVNELWG